MAARWRRAHCGLLLPAPSGSGKTTLTAALNAAGWDFGTDEISLLDIDAGVLRVAPLSACIKEGSWPVLASRRPSLMEQPVHERAGRASALSAAHRPHIERCRATHVVFPRYADRQRNGALATARAAPGCSGCSPNAFPCRAG